ncbi:hypothetical protein TNCV_4913181 [Trichonephila clavipes]|nr:hypothetical protein TNCV_4913181 [Trichonephila clavipes]
MDLQRGQCGELAKPILNSLACSNVQADDLDKKDSNSPQLSNSLTLTDADAIARRKFTSHSVKKHFIPDLNCNHVISTTLDKTP